MPYSRMVQYQDVSVRVFDWRNLKRVDWLLTLAVLALAATGWVLLYSASRSSDILYFNRQIMYFGIGTAIALVLACTDYRFLVALAPLMYVAGVLLLLAVLFFGTVAKGSERWLVLGPLRLQPSETFKLIMVFSLTWYLAKLGPRIRKLHWLLLAFALTGVPMALILKQPNLGTAACLAPLVLVMLFVAGCRKSHLVVVVLMGLSVFPALWWQMRDFDPDTPREPGSAFELKHYQKMRVYAFLHPEYDPRGSGWHTLQSKITVGSGGLSGKGYMEGTQTRLNYLPEHHTDFIYSLLAEEFGFVGSVAVIALFLLFLLRGLLFARDCPDMTGTLLAAGIVTVLAFHIFVNIAITIGLMPVTGIPLPFLSYGGSFYMTTMAGVGILLNVPARGRGVAIG
ncbi:MAG: rod shape-determining protein RodA [Candidatus Hydrogenedens sp.]|nr:rod shape-determining protein RodA [Candidatus Hydrogenedens sp.]